VAKDAVAVESTYGHRPFPWNHSSRDHTSYNYLTARVKEGNLGEKKNDKSTPACSAIALRKMGFAQSLHCTMPISEVLLRGSAPNIFMSRAESHNVGGGRPVKAIEGEGGGGLEGSASKVSGAGEGDCLSLSLRVIIWFFVWSLQPLHQPIQSRVIGTL
jgi:hypothetical protein